MIQLQSVSLRQNGKLLLKDANLTLHPGQRLGLVGKNGTGKSSLLSLMEGKLAADAGEIKRAGGQQLATVAQETPALEQPAIEYVLSGDEPYTHLAEKIRKAEAENDGMTLAELYPAFEQAGGFTARARAARLLDGLGFKPEQIDAPVASFSGGWRMRLNLARALIAPSDLLLLDEPTNHLDLDAVFWLGDWLTRYPGSLVVVSHDRDFLDHVCTHIAHIENQKLHLYTGHYSEFESMRAEKMAQDQAMSAKIQREQQRLQGFIDRFRAKATKAKQAQSRIKALERLPTIHAAHADSDFSFTFRPAERSPDPMVVLEDLHIGYGEKPLIEHVNLQIRRDDRIGVLGPNGAGKTTLIRAIAHGSNLKGGTRLISPGVKVGYYAQHQLEQLDPRDTAMQALERHAGKQASTQQLRDFLGRFGFVGDRVFELIAPFSGGEKARLALALLVWDAPNLLILDEPTNHLDLDMREALAAALQSFEGALLLISHDKNLIEMVCDRFWWVHDGRAEVFDGDLQDYRRAISEKKRAFANEEKNQSRSAKSQPKPRAKPNKKTSSHSRKIEKIEADLNQTQADLQEIDHKLADPAIYQPENEAALTDLQQQRQQLSERIEDLEEQWLSLCEAE